MWQEHLRFGNTLPRRDRKYIGCLCLAGGAICAVVGLWSSVEWICGCGLLPVIAYWINDQCWKIPFFPYDRILSAHSVDGLKWTREPGIRLDVGGLFDSVQVYSPVVAKMNSQWRMYYRAGSNNSSIASAVSDDGVNWSEDAGGHLSYGEDKYRIEPSCILAVYGGWHLYHSVYEKDKWAIWRARSADGLVLIPEGECRGLGGGNVKDGFVLRDGEQSRIYFRRWDEADMALFTAVSADGLDWHGLSRCSGYGVAGFATVAFPRFVRSADKTWRMYFSESRVESCIGTRVASAISTDGVRWQREEGIRLTPGGRYDPHGAFCPDVIAGQGNWRMYYGGFWEKHWLLPWTLYKYRG